MKLIQLPSGDYVNPEWVEAVALNAANPSGPVLVVLNSGSNLFVECTRDEVVAALEEKR